MKKFFALGMLIFLFVFVLTGCGNYSYKETKIETTVIQCEKGNYNKNAAYNATANMYVAQGKHAQAAMYKALANANGYYNYNITVNIEGKKYIIVRLEQYEVNECIVITKVDTYKDSQLVKTEYK